MKRPSRPLLAGVMLAAVGSASCDALLVDPVDAPVSAEITLDPARAGISTHGIPDPLSWGTREVWLRFSNGDLARDTLVVGRYVDGTLRTLVELRSNEIHQELAIQAEVRAKGGFALFVGEGTLTRTGVAPVARIELRGAPALAVVRADPAAGFAVRLARMDSPEWIDFEQVRANGIDASADGSLVFVGTEARVVVLDPYTGEFRAVTGAGMSQTLDLRRVYRIEHPRLAADESAIYFMAAELDPARWTLWRIDLGSEEPMRVEVGDISHGGQAYPTPSNDGTRLAFVNRYDASRWRGDLEILDLETGVTRSVGVVAGASRWSPDDTWIAYRTISEYHEVGLRRVRPDGTDDQEVVPGLGVRDSFNWSHDGRYLFAVTMADEPVRIDVEAGTVMVLSHLGPASAITVVP